MDPQEQHRLYEDNLIRTEIKVVSDEDKIAKLLRRQESRRLRDEYLKKRELLGLPKVKSIMHCEPRSWPM